MGGSCHTILTGVQPLSQKAWEELISGKALSISKSTPAKSKLSTGVSHTLGIHFFRPAFTIVLLLSFHSLDL